MIRVSYESPGLPIAGLTEFIFSLPDATDPDGNQISFAWDLGDGTLGTGRQVRRIYDRGGAYFVEVAVSDERGGNAFANLSIQVEDLDGRWSSTDSGGTLRTFEFTHVGTSITGTYIRNASEAGTLSGSLTPPNRIDVRASIPGSTSIRITRAEINADVTSFTGSISRSGTIEGPALIWVRQRAPTVER